MSSIAESLRAQPCLTRAPEPALRPLAIAYFGLPLGALALAQQGFVPRTICLGHTDAPGARRVRKTLGQRALVLGKPELEDAGVQSALASVRPDVILSWFWPRQIPAHLLALAPRGAFGVHPSLLPRWRGPDPYFWAIYRGDLETGVTLHRLDAEYDTGAIIDSRSLAVGRDEHALRLARRLDRPSLRLLVSCAQRLAAGEALQGTAQDESLATPAPQPDEDMLAIDWQASADEIVRLVRAAAPYPAASAELGDDVVDVIAARVFERPLPRALEPADAVLTGEGVVVRAGDVGVLLLAVRREDGQILRDEQIVELFPEPLSRVR